jgi:hypothetical protein
MGRSRSGEPSRLNLRDSKVARHRRRDGPLDQITSLRVSGAFNAQVEISRAARSSPTLGLGDTGEPVKRSRHSQCQIQCQLWGFRGGLGDSWSNGFSKLLIGLAPSPGSSPSLSTNRTKFTYAVWKDRRWGRHTQCRKAPPREFERSPVRSSIRNGSSLEGDR